MAERAGRRRYVMAARADAVARTKQHIVAAATAQVRSSTERLSLLDIANAAQVSRTTLYRHFPSVGQLLEAVAASLHAGSDLGALLASAELADPVEALRAVCHIGTGIWAADPALVRHLQILAQTEPEAAAVVERLEAGRVKVFERLAHRLYHAGLLRHGVQRSRAIDLLVAATAFGAWDQLVATRRRPPKAASAVIVDLAVRAVVDDELSIHRGETTDHPMPTQRAGVESSSLVIEATVPVGLKPPPAAYRK
jgi:AcrR family transcriptional regulator